MANKINRRDFLQKSAIVAAGLTVVPSSVFGKKMKKVSPSDKLNIAGVGIGGRGGYVLNSMGEWNNSQNPQNIVALCDADWAYGEVPGNFKRYPKAKRFKDYREMFDKMGKSIDAVTVGTPDHTHACIAAQAITMGKHVYCEKPLTHTVYETRLLTKLADKYKVATQMGNQGASNDGPRQVCEAIWSGMIGEVTRVEAYTNRPVWPQGLATPTEVHQVPDTLDWNSFIGPAKFRPYNNAYHPWNWRGWWDFGTGALGDMACHVLDPVTRALKLKYPIAIEATSTPLMPDSLPSAERIHYYFPARDNMPRVAMPAVEIVWYDGGLMPDFPKGWQKGQRLDPDGGAIFYGTKDTLIIGCWGHDPWLLSGKPLPKPEDCRVRAVPGGEAGHSDDWIRACKESPASRVKTASDFSTAGILNEMVVMGVLGVRLQGLGRVLDWDGENMRFTNISPDENLVMKMPPEFTIHEGHPTFKERDPEKVNAMTFANEMIKHTYHNGYTLPEMPK